MKKLITFKNKFYGDYECSKCGKQLNGFIFCVGEEEDIEGYKWRSFCTECEQEIKHMAPVEVYNTFTEAPLYNEERE